MLFVRILPALLILECLFLSATAGLPAAENKDYEYSDDQYNYDNYDDNYVYEDYYVFNPKLLTKPLKIAVPEGTTINLPCHVDKLGGNIVLWYKDSVDNAISLGNTIVNNDKRATVSSVEEGKKAGSELLIGVATPKDEGSYVCQIQNDEKKEIKHFVSIITPPTVKIASPGDGDVISRISQTTLNAKKGDNVTLSCSGEGTPKPIVTWTRLGKKMPDGSASRSETEIMYTKVTKTHEGTYKCTASNGSGNDASKTIKVVVEYEPEIEMQEVFIHSQTGDSVELVCNVHAAPRPTVVWSKNNNAINSGDHANIEIRNMGHKHTLSIDGVNKEDYGTYHCEAVNSLGKAKQQLEISGNAKAAKFSSDAAGQEETNYNLEWSAMSYTTITEFLLEYKEEGQGTWSSMKIKPNTDSQPYHKSGKHYFDNLQAATNYQARVKSNNGEGWSKSSPVFHFATKGAVCADNEFSCSSGHCIKRKWRCDTATDCPDGSDEDNCQDQVCAANEFSCSSGQCIKRNMRCDTATDCPDGSDEDNCQDQVCPATEFRCNSGQCIVNYGRCDDQIDCVDWSDEDNCQDIVCQNKWECKSGNKQYGMVKYGMGWQGPQCINEAYRCDAWVDCEDGSDEDDCEDYVCPSSQWKCQSGTQCIYANERCDRYPNCKDESDENDCESYACPNKGWKCGSGRCVSKDNMCDGLKHCLDGSDEDDCEDYVCPSYRFKCQSGNQCIDGSKSCDGVEHCADGSDEEDCDSRGQRYRSLGRSMHAFGVVG